jgi:adenylate kinase
LQQRSDDTFAVAVKRYETYEKNTKPLIEFYKNLNLLKVVNGESQISEINAEISDLIDTNEG